MNIHEILETIWKNGNNPTRIVSLITKTEPPLLKKSRVNGNPCPWRQVFQITQRYGIIGCSYASSVNRQREREFQERYRDARKGTAPGTYVPFRAQSLWNGMGEHVPGSPYLVRHKQKENLYLAFLPINRNNSPAIVEEVFHDDKEQPIDQTLLTEYMRLDHLPQNQAVKKVVFWRTIEVNNIKMIKCGEEYWPDELEKAA